MIYLRCFIVIPKHHVIHDFILWSELLEKVTDKNLAEFSLAVGRTVYPYAKKHHRYGKNPKYYDQNDKSR